MNPVDRPVGKDASTGAVAPHVDDSTASRAQIDGEPAAGGDVEIVVFWRPACGYCSRLRRQLDGSGVPHRLVNIWEDPAGAAAVRAVTGGNETVPTVVIGEVGLVNPDMHQVLAVAADHAPAAVPEGYEPPEPGRLGRFIGRALGG